MGIYERRLPGYADDDLQFQAYCLKLMKALPVNEVMSYNITYMEGRVRERHSRPQLYGMQHNLIDGVVSMPVIEDPKNLNKRRQAVGLGPYEAELREVRTLDQPKSKTQSPT